jgi:hypothetical protein
MTASTDDSAARIAGALAAGSSLLAAKANRTDLPANQATLTQNPLAPVLQRAIRRAIDDLRGHYPHTGNACTLLQSFDLVAACATSLRTAEFPAPATVAASQAALAAGLDRLLFGHDEREIAFLQDHLLPSTARALRAELAADPTARRAYEAWLSEP